MAELGSNLYGRYVGNTFEYFPVDLELMNLLMVIEVVACGGLTGVSFVRRLAGCRRAVVEEATCEDDKAWSGITVEDLWVEKALECLIIAKISQITEIPWSVKYSFDKSGSAASVIRLPMNIFA